MYSGADRDGWSRFWDKRKKSLSVSQLSPFYKNFAVMMGIINDTGSTITRDFYLQNKNHRSVLEVGAGRGTLSELFYQKGYKTFSTDLEDRTKYPKFPNGTVFVKNDILEKKPFARDTFDVTFTYGLLEHFNTEDKLTTIRRCLEMTQGGGVSMHYVVPKKWTNIKEDSSVYRDSCRDLLKDFTVRQWGIDCKQWGKKFLFPAWGRDSWECSNFMSKGFILWMWKYPTIDKWIQKHVVPTIEKQILDTTMKRLGL